MKMGHTCINNPCNTLFDKACQLLAAGRYFSPGTPGSSTNKTDHPDITEILLKVALNTINLTLYVCLYFYVISIRLWICSDSVVFLFFILLTNVLSDLYMKRQPLQTSKENTVQIEEVNLLSFVFWVTISSNWGFTYFQY